MARANRYVRAAPIELEDASPRHLEHRLPSTLLWPRARSARFDTGARVGCRSGDVSASVKAAATSRAILKRLTFDLVADVVDRWRSRSRRSSSNRWKIDERVSVQPQPILPLLGLREALRVLSVNVLERPSDGGGFGTSTARSSPSSAHRLDVHHKRSRPHSACRLVAEVRRRRREVEGLADKAVKNGAELALRLASGKRDEVAKRCRPQRVADLVVVVPLSYQPRTSAWS